MAYYHCEDFSDDDDLLSDDGNYYEFKEKMKENRMNPVLTDAEKLEQKKQSFYSALCRKNNELVIEYINEGYQIDMDLKDGWTPLLLCVACGNAEITKELIKLGAKIDTVRDGMTTLMLACSCPQETAPFSETLKVIKMLVESGVDPKSINRRRMTALMYAANNGNLPAVEYLVPLSDINAEDNQKWTALFWAINGKEPSVVEYLLQEGSNYMISDVRNDTPLDIAKVNNLTKIIRLFPDEEPDIMTNIVDFSYNSFEDIFNQLKEGEKPQFFLDICNFLCAVKAEATINTFADNKIGLSMFLSLSNDDMKMLEVNLPYQRYRILAGIHKFHKQPFNPSSFYVIKPEKLYSNIDLALQLLTAIKQLIVMEACLSYMKKNHVFVGISKEEKSSIERKLNIIKQRVELCKKVTKKLFVKSRQWDRMLKPVDLITSDSSKFNNSPWQKVIFSVSLLSVVLLVYRLR